MKIRYVFGLCLLLLLPMMIQAQDDTTIVDDLTLQPLIVPVVEIMRGTLITEDMLTRIYIDAEDKDPLLVGDKETIVGQYANGDFMPFMPIHSTYTTKSVFYPQISRIR